MASDSGSAGQDDDGDDDAPKNGKNGKLEEDSDQEEDDEEEEEEPRLEYTSMTKKLMPVYRNADATSAFLVAGDKMVSSY